MKKILAAMAMLLAVVPFVGSALNETTNYYNYTKGQIVNFYRNQESEAAHKGEANEMIILDNKDTSNKFVKGWLIGAFTASNESPYLYDPDEVPFVDLTTAAGSPVRDELIDALGREGYQDGAEADDNNYVFTLSDKTKGVNLISLAELKDVFNVEEITGKVIAGTTVKQYRITNKTLIDRDGNEFSLYKEFEKLTKVADNAKLTGVKNGIWTSTKAYANDTSGEVYVYAIEFAFDANGNITDATIVPEFAQGPNAGPDKVFAFIPTVWANKTADCHQAPTPKEYCYKCKQEDGTFKWVILKENDSKIGDVCELAEDQKKCNPNTGSKSHLLEFSIVAALCAISLLVVRRKDLFRTI
jgi:uncharacterized protein YrzB (UPF0473 family)